MGISFKDILMPGAGEDPQDPEALINALKELSKQEQDLVLEILTAELPPDLGVELQTVKAIFTANKGFQEEVLKCTASHIFAGGSAGGGKSYILVGAALTQHHKSILFRREYPQLRDLIQDSRNIVKAWWESGPKIGKEPYFSTATNQWKHLPGGRILEFGATQHEDDVARYQGRARDLTGIDELPNFTKSQYTFLTGWTRTTIPGQITRNISTGNPPSTPEGEWVIEYWGPWLDPAHPNPAVPGELRWYTTVAGKDYEAEDDSPVHIDGEIIIPQSRTFIPGRITDNPYLMNTNYVATLQALPEPLRSQLLYGKFDVGSDDDPWQLIPTPWLVAAEERWRKMMGNGELPLGMSRDSLTGVGVDVARGGKDFTVVVLRYGRWIAPMIRTAGSASPDGTVIAQDILRIVGDRKPYINIDIIGVGSAVYDAIKLLRPDLLFHGRVHDFHANHKAEIPGKPPRPIKDATDTLEFINKRAAAFWYLRECLDPSNPQAIALPPDRKMRADLASIHWKMMVGGVKIENKEEIYKRIKRSPDTADAIAYAVWDDRRMHGTGHNVALGIHSNNPARDLLSPSGAGGFPDLKKLTYL